MGWQLIIPLDSVTHIKGAIMSPLSIVEQETMDEHGSYKTKHCITHDQSFNPIPETKRSVNDGMIHHKYNCDQSTPNNDHGTAVVSMYNLH